MTPSSSMRHPKERIYAMKAASRCPPFMNDSWARSNDTLATSTVDLQVHVNEPSASVRDQTQDIQS